MEFEPTPRWRFRLFDASKHNFHTPAAPCWFYRMTQRVVLGLVWEPIDPQPGVLKRAWRVVRELWGSST